MPNTNFTRPGVAAAVRLCKMTGQNSTVWESILNEYEFCLEEKGSKALLDLDRKCNEIADNWRTMDNPYCTFDDLTTVVEWKFKKGKPRPLWKLIRSNSTHDVEKASTAAFKAVDTMGNAIQSAIDELTVLRGIGVAAASAILSFYRPDKFTFMDDEVIECLYDGKREYTMKIYHDINNKCHKLSLTLGGDWTPRKIGQALWTAARLSISKSDKADLTVQIKAVKNPTIKDKASDETRNEMSRKRPRLKSKDRIG